MTVSFATVPSKSGWYSWTCPIGTTFAILSIDGKAPVEKETLKMSESWVEISFLRCFSILVRILLGPVDLFESREDMILIISYLPLGLRKKESSDLFLRKLEILRI